MHYTFVYGTLKRGQANDHIFTSRKLGQVQFVGEGRTVEKYPLVVGTPYNIPFLLDSPGTGKRVWGEIYSLDETALQTCDKMEGHPYGYTRKVIQVELEKHLSDHSVQQEEGGTGHVKTVECQAYVFCDFVEELLKSSHIDNFLRCDAPKAEFTESQELRSAFWASIMSNKRR